MNKFWIGPPGTGKTTTLIKQVEKYIADGIDPCDIAYISFTKVAANEAKAKAIETFPQFANLPRAFENFRTLHSLAYAQCPDVRENTIQAGDYADLGKMISFNIEAKYDEWESPYDHEGKLLNTKNPYLFLVNLAACRKQTIEEAFDSHPDTRLKRDITYLLDEEYKTFKKERGLYDYNDYLIEFAKKDTFPTYKVLIIDEAQDLSNIQWDCIERLMENAGVTHIAGDDDQAIYVWAGANVEKFRSFATREGFKTELLKQSYRVPRKMHTLAERIIERDWNRIPKEYLPVDREGEIKRAITFGGVVPPLKNFIDNNNSKTVLVLAATNSMLKEPSDALKSAGIKYDSRNSKPMSEDKINAIEDWGRFLEGYELTGAKIKNIYGYLKTNVKRGYKSGKKAPDDLGNYTLKDCKENFGLLTDAPWDEAFLKLPDEDIQFIKGILNSGRKLTDPAQVRVSTISSIKGAEADVVVLFSDISWGEKNYGGAERHRKWYVAVTRAKHQLIIIDPRKYELSANLNYRDLLEKSV